MYIKYIVIDRTEPTCNLEYYYLRSFRISTRKRMYPKIPLVMTIFVFNINLGDFFLRWITNLDLIQFKHSNSQPNDNRSNKQTSVRRRTTKKNWINKKMKTENHWMTLVLWFSKWFLLNWIIVGTSTSTAFISKVHYK